MTAIRVEDLKMAYGETVVQENISFEVDEGSIFVIMGESGSGKSTLLKMLIGLKRPAKGEIYYEDQNFWDLEEEERQKMVSTFGILYQHNALWSSRTCGENVALPLEEHTELSKKKIEEIVALKLALVGLSGVENYYPSELSGGMKKRVALARAIALDPSIIFFDEPSAGLDPLTAQRLDTLILQIRDSLGSTIIVVTHDLASIFNIADDSIFLDAERNTMIAQGDPKLLAEESKEEKVRNFLNKEAG